MNEKYFDGLMKKYGNHVSGAEDKSARFKSDFTFDELVKDVKVKLASIGTISTVVEKTSNTIRTFDLANEKDFDLNGKKKGVNGYNWWSIEDFNRTFQRIKQRG